MSIKLTPIDTNAPVANARTWSSFQEAVFSAVAHGSGNVVIEAVAGSGKTTTAIEALKRWQVAGHQQGRALFCAFNKSIADELARKVPPGVLAKTLHGVCYGAIVRKFKGCKVDDQKLRGTAVNVVDAQGLKFEEADKVVGDLVRAYGLIKGSLTNMQSVKELNDTVNTYGVDIEDQRSLTLLADLDHAMRNYTAGITFDEMLSFVLDHGISLPQFDIVFVDEAQDMNRMQIEILKRLLGDKGRLVAIGDTYQSIYGFRGADAGAMDRIRSEFNVSEGNQLPLSITYRCPKSVVTLAQQWVPHIQANSTAPEGEVIQCESFKKNQAEVFGSLKSGDMVIARINAPLVSGALKLLAQGRKAIVRGRDIGKNLTALVNKMSKKFRDDQVSDLFAQVVDWMNTESRKLHAARKDAQAQQVEDRGETLLAVMRGAKTISDCKARIERLFSDESVGVVFSSIHKAKGMEAPTVVWFGPEKCDEFAERARSEAAARQELNLSYVAATRAMNRLIMLPLPAREDTIREHDDGAEV